MDIHRSVYATIRSGLDRVFLPSLTPGTRLFLGLLGLVVLLGNPGATWQHLLAPPPPPVGSLDGTYPMSLEVQTIRAPLWVKELLSAFSARNHVVANWVHANMLRQSGVIDDRGSEFLARMWIRNQQRSLSERDLDAAWEAVGRPVVFVAPKDVTILYGWANYWHDLGVLAPDVWQHAFAAGILSARVDSATGWYLDEAWRAVLRGDEAAAKQWMDQSLMIPACEDLADLAVQQRGACRYAGRVTPFPHRRYFQSVLTGLAFLKERAPGFHAQVLAYTDVVYYDDDIEAPYSGLAHIEPTGHTAMWLFPTAFEYPDPAGWALLVYHEALHLRDYRDHTKLPTKLEAYDPSHLWVYPAVADLAREIAPQYVERNERRAECARYGRTQSGAKCHSVSEGAVYLGRRPMRDYVQR